MKFEVRSLIPLLLLITISLLPVGGFAQAISGDLVGTVTDTTGAVVANATVTVENVGTGAKTSTTTSANGEYRFTQLPVGNYNITATGNGLGATIKNFPVQLNQTSTARLTMQVTGAATTVEVIAQGTTIDTTTAQLQTTFDAKQSQDLAGIGLGVLNLSLLNAGVASSGGLGAGTGPSVGGQRPRNNNFTIEGVDNNSKSVTGPLSSVPNDAVANFTVLQNQFTPEFGHSSGGQFNTLVQSGSNSFHGRAYEYFQNRNLNAIDVSTIRSGFTENQRYDNNRFGGQVGGPIVKNKLFFFSNYEYNPIGQFAIPAGGLCTPTAAGLSTLSSIPGLSANNLAIFKKYALPATRAGGAGCTTTVSVNGVPVQTGVLTVPSPNFTNNSAAVESVDWNISEHDQLRARYIYNKIDQIDTKANLPAFFTTAPTRQHLANISEYHTFGSNITNEFRTGFNRYTNTTPAGNFQFPGLDSFPDLIFDDLNLQMGPNPNAPQFTIQNLYQGTDNVSWTIGSHTLKFGVEYHKYISPQSFTQRARGDYEYSSVDLFLRDRTPDVLGERSLGNPVYYGDQYAVYSFANDTWRVTPNVTLTLGLRHEYTSPTVGEKLQKLNIAASVPGFISFDAPHTSKKNFAPRVGIAWSPGSSQTTSVRAGFGMAYDVLYDNIGILSLPPQLSGTIDVNLTANDPNFLATGGIPPRTGLVTFPTIAAQKAATANFIPVDRKLPYSESWNLGVQHVFAKSWTGEVRYVGTRGLHLNVQTRLNRQAIVTGPQNGLPTFTQNPGQAALDALPITLTQLNAAKSAGLSYAGQYSAAGFGGTSAQYCAAVGLPLTCGQQFPNLVSFQPWGDSYYHGLQSQLNRRFENGLQLQAAWTWSHTIDNSTADFFSTVLTPRRPEDFQNFTRDRSTSALDRRHRVTAQVIYDLPFFKNANWLLKNVAGNWEIAPIYTYETPEYATVQSNRDANMNDDSAGDRAIFNSKGVPGTSSDVTALRNSANATVAYLATNPNAQYIRAGVGAFTTSQRNTLALRPINNWDISVIKRVRFTEQTAFEFAAQAFNIFNHPQFVPGLLNQINSTSRTDTNSKNMLVPGNVLFNHPENVFNSNARSLQLVGKFIF